MSAAAIDIRRGDVAKAASFAEYTKPLPFRLPPIHEADLRVLFTELESDCGMRSTYWSDVERDAGILPDSRSFSIVTYDEEDVHMFDLERHCDRAKVWSSTGRIARMAKCRAALVTMGETPEGRTQVILLHLVYGLPDPNAPYQHWSRELAPLARHTPAVEFRRREMAQALALEIAGRTSGAERDREAARLAALTKNAAAWTSARDRLTVLESRATRLVLRISALRATFDAAPREMAKRRPIAKRVRQCRKSQQRAIVGALRTRELVAELQAERAMLERCAPSRAGADQNARDVATGADNAVTASDALAAALDVSLEPRDQESAAERKARRKAAEAVRAGFVSRVAKEAAEMLAEASSVYLAARMALK